MPTQNPAVSPATRGTLGAVIENFLFHRVAAGAVQVPRGAEAHPGRVREYRLQLTRAADFE